MLLMDQELHWNKIGIKYDDEVFDVFKSDRNQVLSNYFRKHANKQNEATDFGCGTGKAFEYLAPAFRQILALDISGELLKLARTRGYKNITYKRADLTRASVKLPLAHFALCCNVAILPEPDKNKAIFKTISRGLAPNGSALIVIPSLESIFYSSWRLIEWYKKEKVQPEEIPKDELHYYKGRTTDILQGIININGVRTKHYTAPELQVIAQEAGLTITALEKLEYDWSTEFATPPSWLQAPYPWDWMLEVRK
jgi:SAM-dependent methyltransferase